MGLESLYLFTMLGGLAAGAYAFETCLRRTREGTRPWLVPLAVVVLFAIGMLAATTHVHSIPRALQSVLGGTVNLGSGMIQEVAVAGVFLLLAVVDLVITVVKKDSPYGLRAAGAVAGVACMIMMGVAYIDIYGNAVWCNAPATILTFLSGDLAMGLALFALLDSADYGKKQIRLAAFSANAVLAVGLCLEAAAFVAEGFSPVAQIAAIGIAPVVSSVLVAFSSKVENKKALAVAVCAASIVGIAISRYAFYATCTVA
ncbi:DMSO reductase [Paraeggerthella sp. Marseille-Q4926]|uniref:DMSO reductase n=1 Tax=Paraeggerthella sp. Marseille-Q4926 TaxID=2866587 RepID=UPI001CE3C1B0|nr:DMSO reductase [Paraeggerthella sp. Marseille-Q4926]